MDFARLLVVAIIIFGVLYFFFGAGLNFGLEDQYKFKPASRNESIPKYPEIRKGEEVPGPGAFLVGSEKEMNLKSNYLNNGNSFSVSFDVQKQSLIEEDKIEVRNGIGDYKEYRKEFCITPQDKKYLKEAKLIFDVDDTNLFNKLIIKLNGKIVFSKSVRRGSYIEVPLKYLEYENELIIKTGSSGWRFWAPTVYILKNVRVETSKLGMVTKKFDFDLNEEQFRSFYIGRLILRLEKAEGTGDLIINVNGKKIYQGHPTREKWIRFNKSFCEKGKNNITFYTQEDSSFSFRNVELILFWRGTKTNKIIKTLEISSSDYNKLPGKIKFNITKIQTVKGEPLSLLVKIIDADKKEHEVLIQKLVEGETTTLELKKDYVKVGKNKVVFTALGKGGFWISDYKVEF